MTAESKHHTSGSLWLAVGLAASAGFVDAFVYVRVTPVFVANMSGNFIHLGIFAGGHDGRGVAAMLVALGGFLAGVILATSHLDTKLRAGKPPRPNALLLYESILLLALPLTLRLGDITYSPSIQKGDYLVVIIGATAMGIQAVALRRVGQIAVSTTYGTGSLVRLGEKLALALRRTDRPGNHRRRITIAVLSTVLVSYVAGATLAASLGAAPELLLLPAAIPLIGAFILEARPQTPETPEPVTIP
jgi:uncharacterized membrane protein YoaK (UPF0700 family)